MDYSLKDFMYYPILALKLTMAPIYQWSGGPTVYRQEWISHLQRIIFLFAVINLIYQNVGMIIYLFLEHEKDPNIDDERYQLETLGEISETGGVLGLTLVAACKMWMLYWYKDRIQNLLEEFEKIFPSKEQAQNYNLYRIEDFEGHSRLLMRCTTIFFLFAFFFYNTLPIIEFLYEFLIPDMVFQYHYQSNTWYPWQNQYNQKSVISFIVAYICQMFASLGGVAYIMAGEFLLCFFITQIRMHIEYLAKALELLDASAVGANDKLKHLLIYHNRLQHFSKEINNIFNISFLVNFATSTIAICLMGFSMVMISVVHAFKYSVGFLAFLIFTLIICYNGSEFTDASSKLMPAAFYSNWYNGDRAYRKMILFFIMRSREPNYLYAYKFKTVSMETYMIILKVSYQLFTFFRAMG